MRLSKFLIFVFLGLFFTFAPGAHAQGIELACPVGSSVMPGHTTRDTSNDQTLNQVCVDKNGKISEVLQNITINGSCTGPGCGGGAAPALSALTDPTAAKTFLLGTNIPLLFNSTGVFTTGQQNESISSTVGGVFPCPYHNIIGGAWTTDALSGCAVIPANGVTNGFSAGVVGLAEDLNSNGTGETGRVEGVGGYFAAVCLATNTQCEGGASQVVSSGSLSDVLMVGHEVSVFPSNTTDHGYGIVVDMLGATVQPTGDNMPAVAVQGGGSAKYTSGFKCEDASIGVFLGCVELGKGSAAGASASQRLKFTANDGTADFSKIITLEAQGVLYTDAEPIIGLPGAWGNYLTSTSAVSFNQLVKIDTSNPDAIVPCTTADTTACMGFVADKLGSGAGGLCGAAGTCAIVTTAGSVVKGILGTGTCAIGNNVVVDTTTNGDVKCQAGIPAQGAWIGRAISAQVTVGQTVDILTKFQ